MAVEYDFVVDLSNVCRSQALGAKDRTATLGALRQLLPALSGLTDGRQPMLLYVADNTLWSLLEATDGPMAVKDWKLRNERHLVGVPYADPAILGFAESSGCQVLSLDKYEDWRRTHPWMQGNTDRFVGWRRSSQGELEIYRRTMSVLSETDASRREEDRSFKDSGYDVAHSEQEMVIGRMYRCDNVTCSLREKSPWFLIGPPRRDRRRDLLVCDHCGEPVTDVGEVGPVSQLKFDLLATGRSGRFTIYQGEGTRIGRQTLSSCLEAPTADDFRLLEQVSGQHVTFQAKGVVLMVADLGSTNGTTIQRFDPRSRALGDPSPLEPRRPIQVGPDDVLTLARAIRIRRAGHRFRYDGLTTGEPEGAARGATRAAGTEHR